MVACLALASVAKMGGPVDWKGQAWERLGEGQGDSSRDSAVQAHGQVGIELGPDGPKAQQTDTWHIWLPSPHQYLMDAQFPSEAVCWGSVHLREGGAYLQEVRSLQAHIVSFLQSAPELGVGPTFQMFGGPHCLQPSGL